MYYPFKMAVLNYPDWFFSVDTVDAIVRRRGLEGLYKSQMSHVSLLLVSTFAVCTALVFVFHVWTWRVSMRSRLLCVLAIANFFSGCVYSLLGFLASGPGGLLEELGIQ